MALTKDRMANPGRNRNYWVDARDWSDVELSNAAKQILEAIEHGNSVNSRDDISNCEFLFELSRRSLPEVRGNYYWPSAYAEVVRRSEMVESEITQQKFEKYFREAIRSTYSREIGFLQEQGLHHKYVILIFQQAGIGKDRNRILREFLEFLVEHYSLRDDSDARSIISSALEEFVKWQPESSRADVSFLAGVLTRIGQEVMVLAHALEREPRREEISVWSWDQLRSFWLSRAGVDLDELTPSASHVILELVSRLSTLWLRSEIFRLAGIGKISVTLPGRVEITGCKRYRDIPVGPAEISSKGEKRSVMIVDHPDLDPQTLSSLEKDLWHWLDDDYTYKVSKAGFEVLVSGAGRQQAVPYFSGKRIQDAVQDGYFWGGFAPLGVIDEPVTPSASNRTSKNDLSVNFGFRWRNDRLYIELKGFHASKPNDDRCSLSIGDKEVWKGELRNFLPKQMGLKWIDISNLTISDSGRTEVVFMDGSGNTLDRSIIIWPLSGEAFLVVGRRIHRNRSSILLWDEGGHQPEIILFSARDDAGLDVQNLDVIDESQAVIRGRGFRCWKLKIAAFGEARVELDDSWWQLDCRHQVVFSYVNGGDINRGDVTVSGVGNVKVIEDLAGLQLQTRDADYINEARLGFWIENSGMKAFCPVEHNDWTTGENWSLIRLDGVLERNGIDLVPGINQFVVGTPKLKSTSSLNFFLLPEMIGVRYTHLFQPSRLFFGSSETSDDLKSDDDVTVARLDEKKMARARLGGVDWEIWFQWNPKIFDFTVGRLFGEQNNYSCSLAKLCCSNISRQIPVQLYSYGGPEKAQINLPGKTVDCTKGVDIDLLPLLSSTSRPPNTDEVSVSVVQGENRLNWKIDLRPAVESLDCTVVGEMPGCVELSVKINVIGFKRELFTISCISDNSVLESREVALDLSIESASFTEMSLAVLRTGIKDEKLDIRILWNGIEIGQSTIVVPSESPPDHEVSLNYLIESYRRTGSLAIYPEILKEAVRLVGSQGNALNIIRNIIPQIGGLGYVIDEQWLNAGLQSLEYIAGEPARNVQIPERITQSADLCAISIALWLVLADKHAAQGRLVPALFDRAINLLGRTLSSGEIASHWAKDLSQLTYAFAIELPSRYEIDHAPFDIDIKKGGISSTSEAAASLANISTNFRRWLEAT